MTTWQRMVRSTADRTDGRWTRKGLAAIALVMILVYPMVAGADPVTPPWRERLPETRPRVEVTVGGVLVEATLARSSRERSLGLGYRDELEEGTGMLFVYEEPSTRSFWMKGMRFCLDIIWVEGGEIVGAAENACPDPAGTPDSARARFSSPEPVRYVLEVPAGWLGGYGFGVGTPVEGIEAAVAAAG